MKPLETPKRTFTIFHIYPATESASPLIKTIYATFAVMVFASNISAVLAHLAYLLVHVSTDAKGSIFAFMGVAAYVGVSYISMTVFILRKQISAVIDKLAAIYNAREYDSIID